MSFTISALFRSEQKSQQISRCRFKSISRYDPCPDDVVIVYISTLICLYILYTLPVFVNIQLTYCTQDSFLNNKRNVAFYCYLLNNVHGGNLKSK